MGALAAFGPQAAHEIAEGMTPIFLACPSRSTPCLAPAASATLPRANGAKLPAATNSPNPVFPALVSFE
jgi:hypothetical protein